MSKPSQEDGAAVCVAPIIVTVEGALAGLAVRDGGRYRFLSVHPGFDLLDGSRFSRPEQIEIAASMLARAARG